MYNVYIYIYIYIYISYIYKYICIYIYIYIYMIRNLAMFSHVIHLHKSNPYFSEHEIRNILIVIIF